MKSVLAVHFWLLLCFDVSLGYPAIERPQPTEDDVYSHSRGADNGAQFVVPEGVELPTREGRVLKTTTVEDVKAWMADTVADNDTVSQSIMLSYAGKVKRAGDILTLTAPNGKVFTFDLAKYSNVIEDVTILEMVKTIIVGIHKIGKAKRMSLKKLIDDLEPVTPVYVIEADSLARKTTTPEKKPEKKVWQFRNSSDVGVHTNAEASWQRLGKLTSPITPAVVAVIDGPVDINHKDLRDVLYTNKKEKSDGKDTDKNGCVDDVHNCIMGAKPRGGNPTYFVGNHGAHISGIIGAVGNNSLGVKGISKKGSVNILSVGDFDAAEYDINLPAVTNILRGLNYAVLMKAAVSNNSYGFKNTVPSLRAGIAAAMEHNHLYVCAIDNSMQKDASAPGIKDFPAQYTLPNMLTVTSISSSGELSYFAGYSVDYVHLAAPGDGILSTFNEDKYDWMSGTSMATPMVAAGAGQLVAAYPTLTAPQVVRIMTQSVRKLPSLKTRVISSGIMDADRALLFGRCEVAFTKARVTCKAKASESDKKKYVSAGAKPAEAEKYALHCEGTAAVLECIQTELKKTKEQACYRRTCDIAEGQCDDSRAVVTVNKKLPVMRLGETCKFGRLTDNAVMKINLVPNTAGSQKEAMSLVREMLTKNVLQANEEFVMDAVMAKNGGYDVSAVIDSYSS